MRTTRRHPGRRIIRRGAMAVAFTATLSLGLSGCFTEASTGGEDRITVAHMQPPRSGLSPMSDDAFKLSRWSTAETLVVLDETGDPLPGLATEWTRTDDLTWNFTIRPDVKFHDGEDLTAKAAAASIQTAIDSTPVPRILDGVELTVKAKGDTVEMTTAVPDPLLPNRLSSPQLSILSPNAYSGNSVDPVGTGTGPFELMKVDGTTSATLDRFDHYWGEQAQASGIDVDFVPDGTARAAALRTGEANIVEAIPAGQASSIDEELLTEVPMPRTNTLYLNNEKGPFKDPKVRAAAREAIDRAEIISTAYEGRADEAAGFLGPALPWAADLRESAEYKDILSKRAKPAKVDGVKISLGTFTDRAELPEVAVLLEQQLEAAGFEVEQDVREYQYIEGDALEGKFDSFMLSRATILDSGDPVAYFASDFTCKGGFNLPQLCNDGIDKAITAAAQNEQGDERRKLTMDAEAEILASDAAIPLLHERVIQGETEGVEDAIRDPRERELVNGTTHVAP